MSYLRFAKRTDTTQTPIIEALEEAGYEVTILGRPVDLLIRHPSWYRNVFVLGECKTRNRKEGYKPDPRQKEQIAFCEKNETPYFLDASEALHYLRLRGDKLVDPYSR